MIPSFADDDKETMGNAVWEKVNRHCDEGFLQELAKVLCCSPAA
jgi:hypothetical protein